MKKEIPTEAILKTRDSDLIFVSAHGGDHHSDRGKWVATGFAVFFLITTIVMTVLYCRQRKIYRELEGDSSLSRLI